LQAWAKTVGAVAFDILVEADAGAGLGQDRCERGLAHLKRITPQVIAIQLDQVEGVQKHAVVSAVMPDEIERGNAVVIAGDSFAIDDTGAGAQAGERLGDQWETTSEVIAGTAIEPHLPVALAGNDAEIAGIGGQFGPRRQASLPAASVFLIYFDFLPVVLPHVWEGSYADTGGLRHVRRLT
jgi:hypothetical protein